MGSCCSSSGRANSDQLAEELDGRAPPPNVEDEAVVKEVLSVSETPKIRLRDDEPKPDRRFLGGDDGDGEKKGTALAGPAEEIRSLSESLSTTATSHHNNNARVWNRRSPMKPQKHRSLSGDLGAAAGRRESLAGGKSPSRRAEGSPGRRFGNGPGSVRIVQPRSADPGRVGAQRGLRPAAAEEEGSARRSRSPAMRSGEARRSARSPGRANGVSEDPSWPAKRNCVDDEGPNDESLDNPLVSLECFIFL